MEQCPARRNPDSKFTANLVDCLITRLVHSGRWVAASPRPLINFADICPCALFQRAGKDWVVHVDSVVWWTPSGTGAHLVCPSCEPLVCPSSDGKKKSRKKKIQDLQVEVFFQSWVAQGITRAAQFDAWLIKLNSVTSKVNLKLQQNLSRTRGLI